MKTKQLSKADIMAIVESVMAKAQAPKAKTKKVKAQVPQWIVERAKHSEARKALAAKMRAQGLDVSDKAVWTAAKKQAGIA